MSKKLVNRAQFEVAFSKTVSLERGLGPKAVNHGTQLTLAAAFSEGASSQTAG